MRENRRNKNSFVIFSDDEGKTWTEPRELPLSLTGDRHTGKYGPDGRLFISFRAISPEGRRDGRPFETDWAGWVGTWDDIVVGTEGQYVVRLKENTPPEGRWEYDTAYPGVEVLPDGTFVVTTYGFWDTGEEPYIISVRFTLDELDQIAESPPGRNR
ncbi:MAG: sialidase family protein [Bacteroidales bacterium]